MTPDRDIERLLDAWLADGPLQVADRVVDSASVRIAGQSQRPAWRIRVWRSSAMTTSVRVLIFAGVVLAALAGVILVSGGVDRPPTPSIPAPTASAPAIASTLASVTPTPPSTPSGSTVLGTEPRLLLESGTVIVPGTYIVDFPAGKSSFTFPTGWHNEGTAVNDFIVRPADVPSSDEVAVMFDMRRATPPPGCLRAQISKTDARSLVEDMLIDADLDIPPSSYKPVTIGDLKGFVLDLTLAPRTSQSCRPATGASAVRIAEPIGGREGSGPGADQQVLWVEVRPDERLRIYVLDAPGGHNIVVGIKSKAGASFERLVEEAEPVVLSVVFKPWAAEPSPSG